jgi:methionyl-tRNA synthetase
MDNETMNAFRERFAGSQSERKERETMTQETAKEETPPVDPVAVFNEKIALKAAKIISISRHPDADKLYIEKLDDGSGNERTIVSGLVPYCTEEELLGKTVIVADNLKPRKMRGVESQGMLLAASCKQADETEILEVLDVSWAAPGTVIIPDGADPAAEKPAEISADVFFSVPLRVEKNNLMVGNTVLQAAGQPVRTGNVADGEVS